LISVCVKVAETRGAAGLGEIADGQINL